jgi:hypothetical protein
VVYAVSGLVLFAHGLGAFRTRVVPAKGWSGAAATGREIVP